MKKSFKISNRRLIQITKIKEKDQINKERSNMRIVYPKNMLNLLTLMFNTNMNLMLN